MQSPTRLVCTLGFLLPVIALNAALAAEPAASTTAATTTIGSLTVKEVKDLMDRKEPLVVYDANERKSYLAGHVPGAQWVAFDAVTAAKLPASKDARLLFYCYNPQCGASPMAAQQAQALGYRNVWLMPEGISGWRGAHMPTVSGSKPK